jgi:hypothetical protein
MVTAIVSALIYVVVFYKAKKGVLNYGSSWKRSQQLKNKTRPYQASYQPVWATQLHDSVIMWIGAHTATVFRTIPRGLNSRIIKPAGFSQKTCKTGFACLKLKNEF